MNQQRQVEPQQEEKSYIVRSSSLHEPGELEGVPTAELVEASLAAGPSGHVSAYRGIDGSWHYVRPDEVEFYRATAETVVMVYVEEYEYEEA
jgi:hypothetical protein